MAYPRKENSKIFKELCNLSSTEVKQEINKLKVSYLQHRMQNLYNYQKSMENNQKTDWIMQP